MSTEHRLDLELGSKGRRINETVSVVRPTEGRRLPTQLDETHLLSKVRSQGRRISYIVCVVVGRLLGVREEWSHILKWTEGLELTPITENREK